MFFSLFRRQCRHQYSDVVVTKIRKAGRGFLMIRRCTHCDHKELSFSGDVGRSRATSADQPLPT